MLFRDLSNVLATDVTLEIITVKEGNLDLIMKDVIPFKYENIDALGKYNYLDVILINNNTPNCITVYLKVKEGK